MLGVPGPVDMATKPSSGGHCGNSRHASGHRVSWASSAWIVSKSLDDSTTWGVSISDYSPIN